MSEVIFNPDNGIKLFEHRISNIDSMILRGAMLRFVELRAMNCVNQNRTHFFDPSTIHDFEVCAGTLCQFDRLSTRG